MSAIYDQSFAAVPARKTTISSSIQRLAMHCKGVFRSRRHSVFAMTQDLIRYDIITQDALRGVVRSVLQGVAQDGLPGEHHFYVTFATRAPGVRLSSRLMAQYPDAMTIVLQHQYWDMEVTEHAVSVGLSFNGIPERLLIPFSSIKRFYDPSVEFGLEFVVETPGEDDASENADGDEAPTKAEDLIKGLPKQAEAETEPQPAEEQDAEAPNDTAEVVSLDAFRKKT